VWLLAQPLFVCCGFFITIITEEQVVRYLFIHDEIISGLQGAGGRQKILKAIMHHGQFKLT